MVIISCFLSLIAPRHLLPKSRCGAKVALIERIIQWESSLAFGHLCERPIAAVFPVSSRQSEMLRRLLIKPRVCPLSLTMGRHLVFVSCHSLGSTLRCYWLSTLFTSVPRYNLLLVCLGI